MPDALGWRAKIAVVAPSTNTIVQPDFDDLRPSGVTNHFGRITVPNMPLNNDADFERLMELIGAELYHAVDRCMTCAPDYLLMGMSSHMFWGGLKPSEERQRILARHCGVGVSAGSFAVDAALKIYGAKRISVISPYQPIADGNVTKFFTDCGYDVAAFKGLRCKSPVAIAHVSHDELHDHLRALDGPNIDAIVQVGTNLSGIQVCAALEQDLGKPVLAINAATYWHGLRALGIDDRIAGCGNLLEDH